MGRHAVDGLHNLTNIEKLHGRIGEYFWDRINLLEKRIGKPVMQIVQGVQSRKYSEVEAVEFARKTLGDYYAKLVIVGLELENLYWDADYHGLDSDGNSCSCRQTTHESRTYPSLMRRLEEIENSLVSLQGQL